MRLRIRIIPIFIILAAISMIIMIVSSIKEGIENNDGLTFDTEIEQFVNDVNEIIDGVDITHTPYGVDTEISDDGTQNMASGIEEEQVNYWSYYDTNLPRGKVIRMESYDDAEYKLYGKVSTEYDYGIVTIRQSDSTLVKEKISYEWFLAIKQNDIIQ